MSEQQYWNLQQSHEIKQLYFCVRFIILAWLPSKLFYSVYSTDQYLLLSRYECAR